jgi:hypothetical protein
MAPGKSQILRCAHCNEPLQHRGRRGPAPTYCSALCRKAASRDRNGYMEWAVQHGVEVPETSGLQPASLDEQAARTILELRALAGRSMRLGREVRAPLSWRFTRLGEGVDALLDRLFETNDR